ncbi:MAG TPA: hypothetical protein VFH44_05715, partial [Solirubrobacterales bacterium]|nr:hypothetical protein [Solirubrobacterales bacterium]
PTELASTTGPAPTEVGSDAGTATEPTGPEPAPAGPPPTERLAGPGPVDRAPTAGAPRTMPRPRWVPIGAGLAAVAALAVVAVLVLGGGGDGGDGGGGFVPPAIAGQPINAAGFPVGVSVADGTVAVATREGERVALFDEGGKPVGEIGLPGPGEGVTIAGGDAWATVPGSDLVVRSPLGGGGDVPIPVGDRPMGITSDGDTIWVVNADGRSLSAVDPASNSAAAPVALDDAAFPVDVAAGAGSLWVVDREAEILVEADPSDPAGQSTSSLGANPKGVVVGAGSVWVANTDSGNVVRLSTDGTEQNEIRVGGEPRLLAYGFGRVWVANGNGSVQAIDPAGDNAVQSVDVPGSPEGVAIGSDQVWVTTGDGDQLVRIDPGGAG